MKPIHQVTPTLSPGDAVSNQVLTWSTLLEQAGYPSGIVCEHVHRDLPAKLRKKVHRLQEGGGELLREGAVVVHYAIAGEVVKEALDVLGPLALCYHNITPAHLLRGWNPTIAELCESARRGLLALRQRKFEVVIAPSEFNAAELRRAGLAQATIVPYVLDIRTDSRAGGNGDAPPLILHVGRIVPNKRIEDVIRVFTLYQRHRRPDASLVLVGPDDSFVNYRRALERLVLDLGTKNLEWTGRVSDARRDAYYRRASAYLCMSVHEGFCIPLVEALAHGVPVVARNAGAVGETLGGAGIVLDVDDLAVYAEALHEVISSPPTRSALQAAGAARIADLAPAAVSERLLAALEPLLRQL